MINKTIYIDFTEIPTPFCLCTQSHHEKRSIISFPMPRRHWESSKGLVHIGKGTVSIKPWSNGLCSEAAKINHIYHITDNAVSSYLPVYTNVCIISSSLLTGKLLKHFEPGYPMKLNIDLKTFCHAFPFHVVFDEQVKYAEIYTQFQLVMKSLCRNSPEML